MTLELSKKKITSFYFLLPGGQDTFFVSFKKLAKNKLKWQITLGQSIFNVQMQGVRAPGKKLEKICI